MPRKSIYGESKSKVNMTLTGTAVKWLESQKKELGATSLSDVIEKLARLSEQGIGGETEKTPPIP